MLNDCIDMCEIVFWIQSRVVPDTDTELIEYFLDTEAQEIEFEIARLRSRQVLSVTPISNLHLIIYFLTMFISTSFIRLVQRVYSCTVRDTIFN